MFFLCQFVLKDGRKEQTLRKGGKKFKDGASRCKRNNYPFGARGS